MYVHISQDSAVSSDKIVAVFDMDSMTESKDTREFFSYMEKSGAIITVSEDSLPRSAVLYVEDGAPMIYLSPISAATLNKRTSPAKRTRE